MGIGSSMKETTKYYYKDPLLDVVSKDKDVNLRGVVIVGCPDSNEDKMRAGERVGRLIGSMKVDGAIFACNGQGNNHVDYVKSIDETEAQGVPVSALSLVPADQMVVPTKNPESVHCFYQPKDASYAYGDETGVLSEMTIDKVDAIKALAYLKMRMRKKNK